MSTNGSVADERRWEAVAGRRAECENEFRYGVRTTGVYCRPTCSSRMPRRENVEFFDTSAQAEQAGYRPCKRCQPREAADGRQATMVRQACREIEARELPPTLDELAGSAGISSSRFHRVFKEATGVTPKQYAAAVQATRVRENLLRDKSVTGAVFAAGFNSSSRFYEQATQILGMQPSTYGSGGEGEEIWYATTETWLGTMLVAATRVGVCNISLGDDQPHVEQELESRFPQASRSRGNAEFVGLVQAIADRVTIGRALNELPLDIQGTVFMRQVWAQLQKIRLGETRTYAQVAMSLGKPKSVRAVASAIAKNPIAVAVPCHRVVRSDGTLGGYRWGTARKRQLLNQESEEIHHGGTEVTQ